MTDDWDGPDWSERRCPRCCAELLTDGEFDVCSLVGCAYGIDSAVRSPVAAGTPDE